MTIYQIVNFDDSTPLVVTKEGKTWMEQVKMIGELEILPLSEQKSLLHDLPDFPYYPDPIIQQII